MLQDQFLPGACAGCRCCIGPLSEDAEHERCYDEEALALLAPRFVNTQYLLHSFTHSVMLARPYEERAPARARSSQTHYGPDVIRRNRVRCGCEAYMYTYC